MLLNLTKGLYHYKEVLRKFAITLFVIITPNANASRSHDNTTREQLLKAMGIHTPDNPKEELNLAWKQKAIDLEYQKEIDEMKGLADSFKEKYGVPLFREDLKGKDKKESPQEEAEPGEVNYPQILNGPGANEFYDPKAAEEGNPNSTSNDIPVECESHLAKNSSGITFVQPSEVGALGAVLFGGQSCSGVKRRDGQFNNWPNGAVNGLATMTPNGLKGKNSANFTDGAYGQGEDLKPVWLGDSGAVQIHSLDRLKDNASLAGTSSKGCLVVNQNCMRAINKFLNNSPDLKFTIIPSSAANDSCTRAVNLPQAT